MEWNYRSMLIGSDDEREGPKCYYYTCIITNLITISKYDVISNHKIAKSKHYSGKSNDHVTAVCISKSNIALLELQERFINLQVLQFSDSDIVEIRKEHLGKLIGLKKLFLSNNNIQSLGADLFCYTPLLEILSFRNNKIQFIPKETLMPLKHLSFADFRGNTSIDVVYNSKDWSPNCITLSTLQATIVLQCKPKSERVKFTAPSYVDKLWQGDFSDFKIKSNNGILFQVHKAVLAVNSPVFAAMFSHQMEENITNEITIENFAPESIKEFMAFLYLRQTPEKCFNAIELYTISEAYQVNELSDIVQWHIIVEVNIENAFDVFKLGMLYNNKELKEAGFQGIEKYFNKKLPVELMESAEGMTMIVEAKKQLDDVLKEVLQSL